MFLGQSAIQNVYPFFVQGISKLNLPLGQYLPLIYNAILTNDIFLMSGMEKLDCDSFLKLGLPQQMRNKSLFSLRLLIDKINK